MVRQRAPVPLRALWLALSLTVVIGHRALAQARVDTAAVLAAAARHYLTPLLARAEVYSTRRFVPADSASWAAADTVFRAVGKAVPPFREQSPPCGGPLPRVPGDTSPSGSSFALKLYSAAGDSAIVGVSLLCRYADRVFGQGEHLLMRRGSGGWRFERVIGTWIT